MAFLKSLPILEGVSDITLHNLCYEYFEFVSFKAGDTIFSSLETEKNRKSI